MRSPPAATKKDSGPPPDAERHLPTVRLLCLGSKLAAPDAVHLLKQGTLLIGRDPPGRRVIELGDDELASRHHATIHMGASGSAQEGLWIVDEGSTNGTLVNGRRVDRCALNDGDLIRIGGSFLVMRLEPVARVDGPDDLLRGIAPSIRALRRQIQLVGPSTSAILLCGETGTGKELVATALHEASGRSGPLVAVACGAIPESLAESHLFGQVAGAFPGALAREGVFRAAHGGTLLLDEVLDLSLPMQAKLLRVLEERAVLPVGAEGSVPFDARIIATTNRDLMQAVAEGRLRGDLYARLAKITLTLRPLRERREDILLLLEHERGLGVPLPPLSPGLIEALLLYPWPYNVRELFTVAAELRMRGSGLDRWDLDLLLPGRLDIPADSAPSPALGPPASPGPAESAAAPPLQRSGEFYTASWKGAVVHLQDSDGLRYLEYLMERPGVEVPATELLACARGGDRAEAVALVSPGDAGPLLDAEAKQAYRSRLHDLREEIEEATSFGDPERARRAQAEIDFLAEELSRAVGLGGRDRKTGALSERARANVTQRIRRAIKRIEESCPELGQHLSASVRTGTFCLYEPR